MRGCGKFVRDAYVERYGRNPLQMGNNLCVYTEKEVKFVKNCIQKYFESKQEHMESKPSESIVKSPDEPVEPIEPVVASIESN